MRCCAIDYGEKKVGYAVGDKNTGLIQPLDTIQSTDKNRHLIFIGSIIDTWSIDLLLISLPIPLDGKPNKQTQKALAFFNFIKARVKVRCITVSEYMSTFSAQRLYSQQRRAGLKKLANIDHYAAAVIMDDWFFST